MREGIAMFAEAASDSVQIWMAAFTLLGTIFSGLIAYWMAKLNSKQATAIVKQEEAAVKVDAVAEKQDVAAKKVEQVKVVLDETNRAVKEALEVTTAAQTDTLDKTLKGVQAVHTLVNANMGAQLKISAVALRRIAGLTGHPDDAAAAELAEKLLHEHDIKQAAVDRKEASNG